MGETRHRAFQQQKELDNKEESCRNSKLKRKSARIGHAVAEAAAEKAAGLVEIAAIVRKAIGVKVGVVTIGAATAATGVPTVRPKSISIN